MFTATPVRNPVSTVGEHEQAESPRARPHPLAICSPACATAQGYGSDRVQRDVQPRQSHAGSGQSRRLAAPRGWPGWLPRRAEVLVLALPPVRCCTELAVEPARLTLDGVQRYVQLRANLASEPAAGLAARRARPDWALPHVCGCSDRNLGRGGPHQRPSERREGATSSKYQAQPSVLCCGASQPSIATGDLRAV